MRYALLVAAALVLGACGDDGTSAPEPTSTTASATTTTAGPTTSATASSSTSGSPTTTTVAWPAARGWVIGTTDGLIAIDAAGTRSTLVPGAVATVAVAPNGTIWFQRASILTLGETTTAADTRVLTYDRATGAVRDAIVPAPSSDRVAGGLHLDDVAVIDGRVQLVLRRAMFDPAKNVEEQRWQESVRRDVVTGAETAGRRVGLWELSATRISFGGGLFVNTNRTEDARRGAVVDLAGQASTRFATVVPAEYCSDATPACLDALTVSHTGNRLAWVESPDPFVSTGRRWNVVVADTTNGRRLATIALPPGNAETVIGFAGDDRLVVSRFPWPDAASLTPYSGVIDIAAGTYAPLAVGGYATADVAITR